MKVFTIGFTKKSAGTFFELLQGSGAERLVDVRLNNVSQLAGFAKKNDLVYFLRELCAMEYVHELRLAPTQMMLDEYKKNGEPWAEYESKFNQLMRERRIEESISPDMLDNAVLLCSEHSPARCHRRLVVDYLRSTWDHMDVEHL